jgi:hypothetical protein
MESPTLKLINVDNKIYKMTKEMYERLYWISLSVAFLFLAYYFFKFFVLL